MGLEGEGRVSTVPARQGVYWSAGEGETITALSGDFPFWLEHRRGILKRNLVTSNTLADFGRKGLHWKAVGTPRI